MKAGNWLQPRYPAKEVFEKDYPKIDVVNPLEVYCPGCRKIVQLTRKTLGGKIAGWCKDCNRGVAA